MSNHQEIIDLAKALTGNEHLYSVQPFIKITGDTLLGLFLERVVYWSDRSTNSRLKQLKIFYKTAEEWEEELGLSYDQVTRARKKLETMGYIQTSKHKVSGAPTIHYYANIGAIAEAVTQFYQSSNSGYANLDNSEIQESLNSENLQGEIEETQKSEVQESLNSSYNSTDNSTNNSNQDSSPNGEVPPPLPKDEAIKVEYTPFLRDFLARFSAKRFRNPTQFKTVSDLIEQHGEAELESLAEWAANKGMGLGQAIPAIKSALKNPKRKAPDKSEDVPYVTPPDPIPPPARTPEQLIWQQVLADSPQIPQWLAAEIKPIPRSNGTFKLAVSSDSAKQWIDNRLVKVIKPTLNRIDQSISEIEVIVQ